MGRRAGDAFNVLRKALSSEPIQAYPNFDKEFTIQTDASLTALGGVLSQIGNNGYEHPIAYCSRVLNKHKRNYSAMERECLAVTYAVKQFRVYVHGVHFKVVIDHSSLTWLQTLKEPEGCLARRAYCSTGLQLEILHRLSSAYQNADCL